MKHIFNFFDFDGTLSQSPLPETGKPKWKEVTGTEYPHKGWWSKPESLSIEVFNIQPNPEVRAALVESLDNGHTNWILTTRLPRLKEHVLKVVESFGIDTTRFDGHSFASNLDKGQRILSIIGDDATEVHVYEDREVEFVVLEKIRETLESRGIAYHIHKIDNGENQQKD